MNDRIEENDNTQLDRLVDGELWGDERRELLLALEAHPEGWRRCALAFLEAQAWRQEMRSLVAAPVQKPEKAAAHQPPRSSRIRGGLWLATAAALLLAFGFGRQFGASEQAGVRELQLAQTSPPLEGPPEQPQVEHAGDAVTLVVDDRRGIPQRVIVPLLEGRELGREFADTPHWSSPALVRRLNEQGLDLAARRRYASLYFEQQNERVPMIVPVDDALVTPVNRPVY